MVQAREIHSFADSRSVEPCPGKQLSLNSALLMTKEEMIALARATAVKHALDPVLVCAVIEQESAWNPWAVRYEPGFLSRYVAPLYAAGKLSATETYTRSMSWGLMQVMGQVAREFGFAGDSLPELCDPATG